MRTLGIDLAARDKDTAYCTIEWLSERGFPELPVSGANRLGRHRCALRLARGDRRCHIGLFANGT